MLSTANVTLAQTAVKETTTTTTTAETINELRPETIIIRTETATEPVRYSYSKTSSSVNEAGAPNAPESHPQAKNSEPHQQAPPAAIQSEPPEDKGKPEGVPQ